MSNFHCGLLCLVVTLSAIPRSSTLMAHTSSTASHLLSRVESYGKLPLGFEINRGQTDAQVKFLSRGSGYTLFLTTSEAILAFSPPGRQNSNAEEPDLAEPAPDSVVRMKLVGASSSPKVEGLEELPGKTNYFVGNDPTKWFTNIPSYGKVRYRRVYPGVDAVYYGNHNQFEHDFIIAPGTNPNVIKLAFEGAGKISVSEGGDLVLNTDAGHVRLQKPTIYQDEADGRREIAGEYRVMTDSQVTFEVAEYDRTKPLVIDPVFLIYSTYLGGGRSTTANAIAVDPFGNASIAGNTIAQDFPTLNAIQSVYGGGRLKGFVSKLNPDGSALVYSSYLGGSGFTAVNGVAADSSGNTYVTGSTTAADLPVANGLWPIDPIGDQRGRTGFLAKLGPTGAVIYATYVGDVDGEGRSVATDSDGNAYVSGIYPAPRNSFLIKLDPTGTGVVYSTNLPSRNVHIAVDLSQNVYILADNGITKLNAAGDTVLYSSSLIQGGTGIAVDSRGNAYVTGSTDSASFPLVNPIQSDIAGGVDAFIAKLNASGTAVVYSTYLGGTGYDAGQAIAVDASGSAYVTGLTLSTDFPDVQSFQTPFLPPTGSNRGNVFVTKLNPHGDGLLYSTYLGGSFLDSVQGIAVDRSGNAYVTGRTFSRDDFPLTANAIQSEYKSASEAQSFITKIATDDDAHDDERGHDQSGDHAQRGTCNSVATGTFRDLTIFDGQPCTLEYAHVKGNVMVNAGFLVMYNSTVDGNVVVNGGRVIISGSNTIGQDVQIDGADTFSIRPSTVINGNVYIANMPLVSGQFKNEVCGSTLNGDLTLEGNNAAVSIGGGRVGCPPNTIGGNVQTTGSTSLTGISGNTIGGDLQVTNNTGNTDLTLNQVGGNVEVLSNATATIIGNTVTGSLDCENNSSIQGSGNTASEKIGQCASF